MHKCTTIIINSFHPSISSNEPFLIKGLFWRGRGGVLKEQIKTNRRKGGVKPISMLTL